MLAYYYRQPRSLLSASYTDKSTAGRFEILIFSVGGDGGGEGGAAKLGRNSSRHEWQAAARRVRPDNEKSNSSVRHGPVRAAVNIESGSRAAAAAAAECQNVFSPIAKSRFCLRRE